MKKKKWWLIPVGLLLVLVIAFFAYVSIYYHADAAAWAALDSDEAVQVSETDYGWYFDGPGTEDALIFYPGAKVEAVAYAPFLHRLSAEGMDVCLVEMPLRFAFFDLNAADDVMAEHDYDRWYIGGHSLGGAMAASYASKHGDDLAGVILCAAYPTSELDESLTEVLLYGSEDTVVNLEKIQEGEQYAPSDYTETVIAGGNHAQFGSYGAQDGDGTATIPAEEQWDEAVEIISQHIISQ